MFNLAYNLQSKLLRSLGVIRYSVLERHFDHTIRVGMVITTLLLTSLTVIVLMKSETMGWALLAGLAGVVALVFIYHAMEYSAFVLIVISTVVNPKLPNNLTLTLLFLMALLGMWLYKLLVVERSFASLRPAPFNKFAVLFIIAVIISYIWSSFYVDPAVRYFQGSKFLPRILTGLVLIFSPLTTLLFANLLRSIKDVKRVVWYFIVFGAVTVMPRALKVHFPPFINIGGQLPAWVGILAFGQVLLNKNLARWQRIVLLVVISVWLYIQLDLSITWLSGWVPLVAGLLVIVFLRSRIAFILITLLIGAYLVVNTTAVNKIIAAEDQESGVTRAHAGSTIIEYANQHFLFGMGPAGYYFYMMTHLHYLFQLSHNNYIDIYAQTGIFGFAAWVLMWLSIGWTTLKAYFASPPGGFVKGLATSLIAMSGVSVISMMLGDWVTPFTYTQTLAGISYTIWHWVWAGMGIALYHLVRHQHLAANEHVSGGV